MEITAHSTQDSKRVAQQLAKKLKAGDVLALYGDLGSGKTTFTSYLVDALGFSSRVQSPTFVLIRNYKDNSDKNSEISQIFHVDLYRLTSISDVDELGLKELWTLNGALTIIEWPEIYEEYLPDFTKKLKFEYIDENSRKIYVQD